VILIVIIYFVGIGQSEHCEDSCELYGKCTFEDGLCVARSDDCLNSGECRTYGLCDAKRGLCVANSDRNCALSEYCLLQGRCKSKNGICVVSSKGCQKTPRCKLFGLCSEYEGVCFVKNDSDCLQSHVCSEVGECFALLGRCMRSKE